MSASHLPAFSQRSPSRSRSSLSDYAANGRRPPSRSSSILSNNTRALPPSNLPDYNYLIFSQVVKVPGDLNGYVRYAGPINGKSDIFVGVELEEHGKGKNSGSVDGIQYFECPINSGIFVSFKKLAAINPGLLFKKPHNSPSKPEGTLRHKPSLPNTRTSMAAPQINRPSSRSNTQSSLNKQNHVRDTGSPTKLLRKSSRPRLRPGPSGADLPLLPVPARNDQRAVFSSPTSDGLDGDTDVPNTDIAVLQRELKKLKVHLATANNSLADRNAVMESRDEEAKQQSSLLTELGKTVSHLHRIVKDRERQIQETESKSASLLAEMEILKDELAEKDEHISCLIADFDSKRIEFRETIETLESSSEAAATLYNARIKDLESNIGKQDVQLKCDTPVEDSKEILDLQSKLNSASDRAAELENVIQSQAAELALSKKNIEHKKSEQMKLEQERSLLNSENVKLKNLLEQQPIHSEEKTTQHSEDLVMKIEQGDSECLRLRQLTENLEGIVEAKTFKEQELEEEIQRLRKEMETLKSIEVNSSRSEHFLTGSAISRDRPSTPPLLRPEPRKPEGASILDPEKPEIPLDTSPSKHDPASGRDLWCGLCERQGHTSIECPYEDDTF